MSDLKWCEIDEMGGNIRVDCEGEETQFCYPATDGFDLEAKVAATGGSIGRTKTRMRCEQLGEFVDR